MTLDDLSQELGDALEVNLQITGGDEFQGLFRDPPAIVDVYMGVWERLPDVMFVYGIGAGELTTDLSDRITEVDGPCFHRAKAALERAQKENKQVEAEGVAARRAISTVFHLLHRIRSSWTETQRRYALAARTSTTHASVAEQFEVSSPAISQTLKRAEYALFREAEGAARELLSLSLEERLLLKELDSHEEG